MIARILFAAILLAASAVGARAWLIQGTGTPAAASCNAKITTSSGDGNAILTGSATALANLTCQ